MDADMVTMFPNGIRALMIDDDTKFLKSATTLLSVLNFNVVRCSSVAHALKSLTSGGLIGFDVILVHAANATACGFDFRAIVETDLLIPVIYLLEEDYEATGDEAHELLRTLQAPGSYVIKKPLDIDEVRTRLWTVIAFRKCDLQTKASRGGAAGGEGGVGGDDEGRVHFKAVTKGRGRKRKGGGSRSRNPGGSSGAGTTIAAGGHRTAKGKEMENVSSQLQQNDGRAKKAQKNGGGEVYNLPQPNTTMTNGHQQPNPSNLFMQSFLRMLTVPPNNPEFFTKSTVPMPSYSLMFFPGAAGPSSNAAAFGNTINTTSGTSAAPHPLYSAGLPALHPVARQQQHPSVHNNVIFGNIVPSPAAAATPTMAATAASAAYESPQFSQGISKQQSQDDAHPLLMFGPFPYQGSTPPPPPPPMVEQDILAPPVVAGDPFTGGMAAGAMASGASAAAATEAVAYDNNVSLTFLQDPNLGPPMVPQQVSNALDEVAMLESLLNNSRFNNYNAGSPVVVPEELTAMAGVLFAGATASAGGDTAGGASSSSAAAATEAGTYASASKAKMLKLLFSDDAGSSVVTPGDADQVPGLASSLNELTTLAGGGFDNNNDVSLMASQGQGTGATAMEGDNDDDVGHKEAILPSDQYEDDDNTSFPLDALLGDLHSPMFELDDGVGTSSLIAGEEGGNVNGLANLAGIDIPHDVWHLNDLPSLQSQSKNKNNVRE